MKNAATLQNVNLIFPPDRPDRAYHQPRETQWLRTLGITIDQKAMIEQYGQKPAASR